MKPPDSLQSLVERSRHDDEPSDEDRGRVLRAVTSRVAGVVAAAAVATHSQTVSAATTVTGTTVGLKLGVPIVLLLGAGAGVAHHLATRPAAKSTHVATSTSTRPAPLHAQTLGNTTPNAKSDEVIEAPSPRSGERVSDGGSMPIAPIVAVVQAPTPTPRERDRNAISTGEVSIAQDLAALREAQRALQGGDPSLALESLSHMSNAPALALERQGLRWVARCMLQPDAQSIRTAAISYVERNPELPLRDRILSVCRARESVDPSGRSDFVTDSGVESH